MPIVPARRQAGFGELHRPHLRAPTALLHGTWPGRLQRCCRAHTDLGRGGIPVQALRDADCCCTGHCLPKLRTPFSFRATVLFSHEMSQSQVPLCPSCCTLRWDEKLLSAPASTAAARLLILSSPHRPPALRLLWNSALLHSAQYVLTGQEDPELKH